MASDVDLLIEALKIRLQDPRYIILAVCFAIGFLSIFAGAADSDWAIIGPTARWIDEHVLVPFIGSFLRLIIGIMAATFVFQFLMALVAGEARLFNLWGWISTVLLVLIIVWLIGNMAAFFGTGQPGSIFSVVPGIENFVGGP